MSNGRRDNNTPSLGVPRRSTEPRLYSVPRWDELIADPGKVAELDAYTARVVAARTLGVFVASLYRLFESDNGGEGHLQKLPASRGGECVSRILEECEDVTTLEEIARLIGKDRRWITRNAAKLPFVIRLSRKNFVCSRVAFRRWLATRPRSLRNP
jgi:hypothetical protein